MKRALIVDDSRLARAVLSRLLTQHGVATDTAESAEVALDYLKHSRPDVVFLDHNMPGMGGFEALDTIKKNPSTATIPVMMYTSQEGELYVGQARALGALGVLPKTLQPVEVVNVLRSLHLIPATGEPRAADAATGVPPAAAQTAAPSAAPSTAARPLDAESLRELLESLFSEHASSLRGELRRELQRLSAATAPALAPPQPPAPIERRGTARLRGQRALTIASALLVAIAAVLGYLYFETRTSLDEANERTRRLADDIAAISDVRTPVVAASKPGRGADVDSVLGVLEWGINRGGRYAFGATPLDDERATALTALFAQLEELEFAGTVTIDVHVGRFCMNYRSDGMLELAPAQQPAATCEQIGWPESEAVALGQRQSLAFANTVASATARNPNLRVASVSRGSAMPAVEYPLIDYELTAGAWNTVAAANHRVEVQLIANDVTAGGARR